MKECNAVGENNSPGNSHWGGKTIYYLLSLSITSGFRLMKRTRSLEKRYFAAAAAAA